MKHDRDFDLDDEAGAELDEETRQVLAALREAGRTPAPPAGFVNQLNAQLRQEYEMKDKTLWSQFRRWLPAAVGAGVMMAVVAAAILIIPQYMRPATELEPVTNHDPEQQVDTADSQVVAGAESVPAATNDEEGSGAEPASSGIVVENAAGVVAAGPAGAGGFGAGGWNSYPGIPSYSERPTYELAVTLGGEPQTVTEYVLVARDVPDTAAEAVAWATAFGFATPRAYSSLQSGDNSIFVTSEDGQQLNFFSGEGYGEIFYNDATAAFVEAAEPIGAAEALALAELWWAEHGFGPDQYRVELDPLSEGSVAVDGTRTLVLKPLVNGVPASGWAISGDMSMNGAGNVVHARIPGFELAANGETTVISQQAAYEAVVDGGRAINYLYRPETTDAATANDLLILSASPQQFTVGEQVTLQGWAAIWRGLTDNGYYAELYDVNSNITFVLVGTQVAEMAAAWPLQEIRLDGVIVEMSSERTGLVEVSSWQENTTTVAAWPAECFVGSLAADGTLTTESGLILHLDNVNGQMPADATVETCGEVDENDNLLWTHIMDITLQSVAGDGSLPYTGPIYHAETGGELLVIEDSATPVLGPDLVFGPEVSLELGDEVNLTGQISGGVYINQDGEMRYELYLNSTVDDEPAGLYWSFRLYGEPELLAELAENYYQYVTIAATVISGQGEASAWFEPGLRVTSVTPIPSEPVQGHLGRVEFREVAGEPLMVFIDNADGVAYAIDPYYPTEPEFHPEFSDENFSQIWMALSVHPYWEYGGLPVAQMLDLRYGREVNQLVNPDILLSDYLIELPVNPDYLAFEGLNNFPFTGHFVIERVELSYIYEPGFANPYIEAPDGNVTSAPSPVWVFYGTDRETGATLMIQVDAAP
ncbi:MAG: hypothetical protein KDE59_16965 [Anaerolineales bacterium]|nr:hypothetical protein [Anaerolineales bacterium]